MTAPSSLIVIVNSPILKVSIYPQYLLPINEGKIYNLTDLCNLLPQLYRQWLKCALYLLYVANVAVPVQSQIHVYRSCDILQMGCHASCMYEQIMYYVSHAFDFTSASQADRENYRMLNFSSPLCLQKITIACLLICLLIAKIKQRRISKIYTIYTNFVRMLNSSLYQAYKFQENRPL